MIVTPLSDRGPTAIRDALLSHGWEGDLSLLASTGLSVTVFEVRDVDSSVMETMVMVAARLGLELVTGEDWLILAGPRSRLGAFARPWTQPEQVQALANAIGMALPDALPVAWRHATGSVRIDHPVMVGVVNVTPDSFSDGGRFLTVADALAHATVLLAGGASILDVGGESTRPGARPVSEEEEQQRVLPVLAALVEHHPAVPISIDTVHANTARLALDAGAVIINDVTAGRHDPAMLALAAKRGAGLVLSHSRGPLGQLASYSQAEYDGDVCGAVSRELAVSAALALEAGVSAASVILDPGFGFAKTPAQSFTMLDHLDGLVALGFGVLVGVSRKRFLAPLGATAAPDPDRATAAACIIALDRGARLFRVHDPAAVRDALAIGDAMLQARI